MFLARARIPLSTVVAGSLSLSVGSPLFLSGRGCIAGVWLVLTPWPRSAVREVVRAFSS